MKDDGGSAFPVNDIAGAMPQTTDELKQLARGMTLRDYFAAKVMPVALQDMWAASVRDGTVYDNISGAASFSYKVADAMIEARNK